MRSSANLVPRCPLLSLLSLLSLLGLLGLCALPLRAQTFGEKKAFDEALQSYNAGNWDRAERELAEFTRTNVVTARYFPDAALLRASANFHLTNYAATIDLLTTNLPNAGSLADQYVYWVAKASYAIPQFSEAAAAYGRVARDYPGSTLRLDAIFHQAEALSKIPDWPQVIDLLSRTNGAFQQVLQLGPTNEVLLEGLLLLAQAQVQQREYSAAGATLRDLASRQPGLEMEWKRQHLLGELQAATGHPDQVLETSTNLVRLAGQLLKPSLQAESIRFQADALEQLNRLPEALEAAKSFEEKLGRNPSPEQQRDVAFKIAELNLRQNNLAAAGQKMEEFLGKHPDEQSSDLALLTLGELRLRRYFLGLDTVPKPVASGPAVPATNLLQQASNNFAALVTTYTNSDYRGAAWLDLGWCFWADGKTNDSQAAFGNAVRLLPASSADQAVARFKLADIQYQRKDFAGAASNYNSIIDKFGPLPAVQSGLVEQALYQVVRSAMGQNDETVASQALRRILQSYPESFLTGNSVLLLAQWLNRRDRPAQARQLLLDFTAKYPDSTLVPEAQLAVARTYEKESDWPAAIKIYEDRIGSPNAATNQDFLARAQFCLAWDHFLAGNESNAFVLFTNFVVQSSNHFLAPYAQNWIADHYARTNDVQNAERSYQLVFNTWPNSEPALPALMNAGRMAVQQGNNIDAQKYFTNLLAHAPPPPLALQARFAYGDTLRLLAVSATNRDYYFDAIGIFTNIYSSQATNAIGALALIGAGQCYEALADTDTNAYSLATTNYQRVIDSPLAGVAARGEAEDDLGAVLEKMAARLKPVPERRAMLLAALDHYLNVVQGTRLREGEKRDPFWVKKAGLDAGTLEENLGMPEQSVKLYDKLAELLPSMRDALSKKRARAAEAAQAGK